ncbi:TRAP transporter 4TM/12TM fusion protein [Natronocella acetinitrilica]|uniref:TRAP transporter 4TM/12TM fusion protein n=1 Tax=Natronocella acetinitrilica TaxID=414046 RepID=A0AAE3G6Y0_9GAMM|nr:TRAP transporter permease [Natronocella acetinitrilica]MCP1676208.1 TRAP transporter 4TM/12TM fusion protein [Natronocella acetinitrilica]
MALLERLDGKQTTGGLVTVVAVSMALYHLYTAHYGVLAHWQNRAIHLSFALTLIFLIYRTLPNATGPWRWLSNGIDLLCLAAVGYVAHYSITGHLDIQQRAGLIPVSDQIVAAILIFLVLEATRRCVGIAMTIIAGLFLLFVFYGTYLPGQLGHPSFSYARLTNQFYNSTGGIFGAPIAASSVYIVLFIIFGAFLNRSGAGDFFSDLSRALTGKSIGGPAKAAVVASGLTGSVTGSAVANVATTGPFTIPVMIRYGYSRVFSGSVEAAASTGGQVLPPVMGATAFIIAEFTRTPYNLIALYALFPALLYFLGVFAMVHLEAKKNNIPTLKPEEIPNLKNTLLTGMHNLIPLLVLIGMLVAGFSPMKAGFYAIVLVVVISWFRKDTRMMPKDIILALRDGAVNSLVIVMACAAAGLIVGSISVTGLGLKFSAAIISLSGGLLLPALILTALASLVLGMGMISISAYVILASLAAPALVNMGAEPVAAHLFVYFFGILSNVTPPICIAAFTAAGIAGASQIRTGLTATRLAATAFIIPFMFVIDPRLMLMGEPMSLIIPLFSATVGVLALAAALQGYLLTKVIWPERIVLLLAALALLSGNPHSDVIGIALGALALTFHIVRGRRQDAATRMAS